MLTHTKTRRIQSPVNSYHIILVTIIRRIIQVPNQIRHAIIAIGNTVRFTQHFDDSHFNG